MSSSFGQIPPLTTELVAIERLKIDISTCSRLILMRSFQSNKDKHNILDKFQFGQNGPPTTESAALERLNNTHIDL